MDLRIDADDLNACVQCGLCLPHCPTYRVTGDEALSPRGRIHLMREVQDNAAPVTPEVVDAFDTCVQCRGCEPACPSGVPYGRLIESTRAVLADMGAVSTRRQRLAFWALSRPHILRLASSLLAIAARLRLVPKRLGSIRCDGRRERRSDTQAHIRGTARRCRTRRRPQELSLIHI